MTLTTLSRLSTTPTILAKPRWMEFRTSLTPIQAGIPTPSIRRCKGSTTLLIRTWPMATPHGIRKHRTHRMISTVPWMVLVIRPTPTWTPPTLISNLTCSQQTTISIRTSLPRPLLSRRIWRRSKPVWTRPSLATRRLTTRMQQQPVQTLTRTSPQRIRRSIRHQQMRGPRLTRTRQPSLRRTNRASPPTTLSMTRMLPHIRRHWTRPSTSIRM
jgi:hypothetical protein